MKSMRWKTWQKALRDQSCPLPYCRMQLCQWSRCCMLCWGTMTRGQEGVSKNIFYLPLSQPSGGPWVSSDLHQLHRWHVPKETKSIGWIGKSGIGSWHKPLPLGAAPSSPELPPSPPWPPLNLSFTTHKCHFCWLTWVSAGRVGAWKFQKVPSAALNCPTVLQHLWHHLWQCHCLLRQWRMPSAAMIVEWDYALNRFRPGPIF